MKKMRTKSLHTPFEDIKSHNGVPFSEYPRPSLKRDSYLCLNGAWSLSSERKNKTTKIGTITVPFPPESNASGISRNTEKDEKLIYLRSFSIPEGFKKDRTFLHFGACDQITHVYLNGKMIGSNTGGYLPFSFDITDYLYDGENELKVICSDAIDPDLPYGKQTFKRGGMWYTNISGIWQTVWIESVPEKHIQSIRITPTLSDILLEVSGGEEEKNVTIKSEDSDIKISFKGDSIQIPIKNPHYWTPEDPFLYEITISTGQDIVESYFALRTVSIKKISNKSYICLNDKPYFFHGLLDQGYFSDGIFLPAHPNGFKFDILKMKACGFNMLRKHIKLEPELFYYYCDKYGMAVFQDFINNGRYNFIVDTALPTLFHKIKFSHSANKIRREAFLRTSKGIVDTLFNHPCVIYYTIFNEGWGQFDADGCYDIFKNYDSTRIWDSASGWFKNNKSDVTSEHIYFKPVKLKPAEDKPLILSEFGGYSCKLKDHSFNLDRTYGYRFFDNLPDFENALIKLYTDETIPNIRKGLCATVLTQVSDVEDETNGLLTYDRKVLKVNENKMKELSERLLKAFKETAK